MNKNLPKYPTFTYNLEDKQEYEGSTLNGLRHGQGILKLPTAGQIWRGTFKDGMFFKGKITLKDGSTTEGRFHDSSPISLGVHTNIKGMKLYMDFNNDIESKRTVKIELPNKDSFTGFWNPVGMDVNGFYSQISNKGEKIKTKVDIFRRNSDLEFKENLDIGGLYYYSGISSFKIIDMESKEFELVYENGDKITGIMDSGSKIFVTFTGTINYSENRYPSFTGRFIDFIPKSGKGICYLHNLGEIYEGNFDSNE